MSFQHYRNAIAWTRSTRMNRTDGFAIAMIFDRLWEAFRNDVVGPAPALDEIMWTLGTWNTFPPHVDQYVAARWLVYGLSTSLPAALLRYGADMYADKLRGIHGLTELSSGPEIFRALDVDAILANLNEADQWDRNRRGESYDDLELGIGLSIMSKAVTAASLRCLDVVADRTTSAVVYFSGRMDSGGRSRSDILIDDLAHFVQILGAAQYAEEDSEDANYPGWKDGKYNGNRLYNWSPPKSRLHDDELERLRAVYDHDEVKAISTGVRVDQVVLARWYKGGCQPADTGIQWVDDAVRTAISHLNMCPIGQPAGAPSWSSVRY